MSRDQNKYLWINARKFLERKRLYSVVVITLGFDPSNPSSNPGTTFNFCGKDSFFALKTTPKSQISNTQGKTQGLHDLWSDEKFQVWAHLRVDSVALASLPIRKERLVKTGKPLHIDLSTNQYTTCG